MNILKIVSDRNNYYLVDGFSNEIYQLESLDDLNSMTINDIEEYNEYQTLIQNACENKITNNAKTLTLEITEQCNLRCTYCVFDESYESERIHNNFVMTKEIAFQAIDNYKTRINTKEAYIVFYGGEPLIRFDFIKDITKYAKEVLGDIVKFSFTTNGVYLTKEKIEYFQDHNFLITISLDGNQKIHDTYRLDNHKNGTFEKIMKNLEYIYNNNLEYYKTLIQFTCVVNSIQDFKQINKFFSTHFLVKDNNIRFSSQIQNSYELSEYITQTFTKKYILQLILTNEFSKHPLEHKYFSDLIKKIKYRVIGEKAKSNKVKCVPFSNRTYVRANGNVQFCERIENMGITDLSTESMINIAKEYLVQYQNFIEKECNDCFAYNYCEMCYASFVENSKLNKDKATKKCSDFRSDIQIAFEIYIELMENNESLLEQF